jgi:hypothetical protein
MTVRIDELRLSERNIYNILIMRRKFSGVVDFFHTICMYLFKNPPSENKITINVRIILENMFKNNIPINLPSPIFVVHKKEIECLPVVCALINAGIVGHNTIDTNDVAVARMFWNRVVSAIYHRTNVQIINVSTEYDKWADIKLNFQKMSVDIPPPPPIPRTVQLKRVREYLIKDTRTPPVPPTTYMSSRIIDLNEDDETVKVEVKTVKVEVKTEVDSEDDTEVDIVQTVVIKQEIEEGEIVEDSSPCPPTPGKGLTYMPSTSVFDWQIEPVEPAPAFNWQIEPFESEAEAEAEDEPATEAEPAIGLQITVKSEPSSPVMVHHSVIEEPSGTVHPNPIRCPEMDDVYRHLTDITSIYQENQELKKQLAKEKERNYELMMEILNNQ